jgi:hypothetical protein
VVYMKRRFGDLYLLRDCGEHLSAIQHACDDSTLLGSNVVRALIDLPTDWERLDDEWFVGLPAAFWAHVFLSAGETLSLWSRIGNRAIPQPPPQLTWCAVHPDELRQPQSTSWHVWRTDGTMRDPQSNAELEACEFGYVMSPRQIAQRMVTGQYSMLMPARRMPT